MRDIFKPKKLSKNLSWDVILFPGILFGTVIEKDVYENYIKYRLNIVILCFFTILEYKKHKPSL